MTLKQPIKWHGGKYYLAPWIITSMPKHLHYVEPYFGGGSVLLQKVYANVSEVVNDLNGELMNFWGALKDVEAFEKLTRMAQASPLSEDLFNASLYKTSDDPIERAFLFFIRARQSRQGLMKSFATLSRNRIRRGMNEQASSWLGAIEGLPEIHKRLKGVVVLNHSAIDVIKQQDGDNTFFYCDPPYLHSTRTATNAYSFEMQTADHEKLLATLGRIKGKFLLSGYPSSLYDEYASKFNWNVKYKSIDNKASSSKIKEIKTECLWYNY